MLSGYTHPLPSEGPPFEPWVLSTEPIGLHHLVIDLLDDPSFAADSNFIPDDDALE